MTPFVTILLAVATSGIAWWLTGRLRRYAMARRVLDVPNERSSHVAPTPRGGGMAMVAATIGALFVASAVGLLPWRDVVSLGGGGALVAALGFADDHGHLKRRWRLLGHFAAAAWVLGLTGGMPPLHVFGFTLAPGWPGHAIALLSIVWMLNLTNFMDGIDGIAAVEGVSVCLGAVVLYAAAGADSSRWVAPVMLAAATLGFLAWNWPPAKIFMGDGGSGFLGLSLATLSLQAAWISTSLFWAWIILLGVFVVDATLTLVRRAARGERVHDAHRTHAYQHAARRWGSHKAVTLAVLAINVGWLLPLALLVARHGIDALTGAIFAYSPLLILAVMMGAGAPTAEPVGAAATDVGNHHLP